MKEERHFHFVGICGTAMGYLAEQGLEPSSGYRAENIPEGADTIVIGNAISRGNEEAEAALDRKLLYVSLPEVLKEHFLRGRSNLVVSGTHGKTTTASMLAWLLESAGREPGFMIGGLPRNFGRGARFTDSGVNVLEGDEYDTAFFDKRSKFLHYLPELVVVNNIEFDHADIYDTLDEIKLSFRRLLNVVPRNGLALINGDDPNCLDVAEGAPAPVRTVGLGDGCDLKIEVLEQDPEGSGFRIAGEDYRVPMVGEFNVRNAAMAASAAEFAGLTPDEIRTGLDSFKGVARRQELRGEVAGVRVVDDFAHHPTAVGKALAGLRQSYPGARLWAVFEPRSNTTRRNIFQQELAEALAVADVAVVAGVPDPEKFPADERLDPAKLAATVSELGGDGRYVAEVPEIVEQVAADAREGDVIAVLSNGGFGGIHRLLLERLGE